MYVCIHICRWTFGRLSVDLWWTVGRLLVDFWWTFGGRLVDFWWTFGLEVLQVTMLVARLVMFLHEVFRDPQ